jgi:tRNA (cmo5U34)-methyltransferase
MGSGLVAVHRTGIIAIRFIERMRKVKTDLMESAKKFDDARAGEYETQSRIGLAGYHACHELAACLLVTAIGPDTAAHVLVAGAGGTGEEIKTLGHMAPSWHFTAADPSGAMLALALGRVHAEGLGTRTTAFRGTVDDLRTDAVFDAATLIGVLHHVPGEEGKRGLLSGIASRLKPGAPFVIAGNCAAYASRPDWMAAWAQRWRMFGTPEQEVQAKLGKILQGADPPVSEADVHRLLTEEGFEPPQRFFASLFWGAWITRRRLPNAEP